jgi:TDG/mug DNA glycosylase family protein
MWKILLETGINTSSRTGADSDDVLQDEAGVGFIDVGVGHPGTDSSKFTSEDFATWSEGFYYYLGKHLKEANESIGCRCGKNCGAPKLIAFTGKRQFVELLNANCKALGVKKVSKVGLGPQDPRLLPSTKWPFPRDKTQAWVLTSTSGASALTNEARIEPYQQLSDALSHIPWPMTSEYLCCCSTGPKEKPNM